MTMNLILFFVLTFVALIRCFQQLLPYLPAEVVMVAQTAI